MSLQVSQIIWDIQNNPNVRNRALSMVMKHRWDGTGNVSDSIDLEQVMWAVSTNDTVIAGVQAALDSADKGDERNTDRAILQISENDLEYIVASVAIPRLAKESAPDQTTGAV